MHTFISGEWQQLPQRVKRPASCPNNGVKHLYTAPLKIKKDKFDDLQYLKAVIPQDCHMFYDNLSHL